MTQPTPAEQLLNLADRAERGQLTGEEAARLRAGIAKLHTRIDEYRDSRKRWMDAAYADRRCALKQQQRAERAEAAIERVRKELAASLPALPSPNTFETGAYSIIHRIRAALDEHQEQRP